MPLWCVCGGCGGSGPGIRTRLRWGVIARWPRWCSRSSARRSTRTGAGYRQVAAVFGRAMRTSSAVECMNSVLRMHQTRHKTLSQGMLDLKRLSGTRGCFRGGKPPWPLPLS